MKKKILLSMAICMTASGMVACARPKGDLTYGTLIPQTIFSLVELTSDELFNRLIEREETILLAIYQGEFSEDCLCWATFENVIANYMNNYHEIIYIYNAHNLNDELNVLNIRQLQQSTPALYIFQGEKQLAAFSYDKKQDQALFEDMDGAILNESIHRYVNAPKMYYVDKDFIDQKIVSKEDFVVGYVRETCGDCHYVMPNVIIPYIKEHNTKKNIYLFEFQKYFEAAQDEEDYEAQIAYQELKDQFHMSASSDLVFGYKTGVVPTIHYYSQGKIVDANVYFNDSVEKVGDKYIISDSYYSTERVANLTYTKTVLKGLELNEEDVIQSPRTGNYHWLQEKAALKHTAILKDFLDNYLY